MAIIDVEDLVGKTFPIPDENGILQPSTIIEAITNHEDNTSKHSTHTKFRVQCNSDKYEQVLAYDQLMDHIERDQDIFWEPGKRGPPSQFYRCGSRA